MRLTEVAPGSVIRDVVQPANDPAVFEDTNAAKQALLNGQVDAILADVPTAYYITAVEIPEASIVGQFQPETGEQEEFGMLFEKGSELYEYVETICPSSDCDYDYAFGLTHLDWLALMSKRYGEKYRVQIEALERWVEAAGYAIGLGSIARGLVLLALLVGAFLALAVWWGHERYETAVVRKAEIEASKRVQFPSPKGTD